VPSESLWQNNGSLGNEILGQKYEKFSCS